MSVEYSNSRGPSAEAMVSLARAAGIDVGELIDNYRAGGSAALRHAAEKAQRRGRVSPRTLQLLLLRRKYPS